MFWKLPAGPDMSLLISALWGGLGVPSEAKRSEQHSGSSEYRALQYFNNRNGRDSGYSHSNSPGFREAKADRRKLPSNPWAQTWYLFFNIMEASRTVDSPIS